MFPPGYVSLAERARREREALDRGDFPPEPLRTWHESPRHLYLFRDSTRWPGRLLLHRGLCGSSGMIAQAIRSWTPDLIENAHVGVTCRRCLVALEARYRERRFPNGGEPLRAM